MNFKVALFGLCLASLATGCNDYFSYSSAANETATPAPNICAETADPASSGFQSGDGSALSPFGICTAVQLDSIGDNFLDKHFVVLQDIDMSSILNFNVIGSGPGPFMSGINNRYTGTFDGGDFDISNLTQTSVIYDYYGMIGSLGSAGKVLNTHLSNINIDHTADMGNVVGGLVGYSEGEVRDSSTSGIVLGYTAVGGLIGSAELTGIVSNSHSSATVTGYSKVGGLIGFLWDVSVDNSYATGSVTGERYVGGLIGEADSYTASVTIDTCYSTGLVTGISGGYSTGGLIGEIYADTFNIVISNSSSIGDVTGDSNVGGFIGRGSASASNVVVNNSFSTGDVYVEVANGGGAIGYLEEAIVTDFYSSGLLSNGLGATELGGLIGSSGSNTYSDVYWNTATLDADGTSLVDPDPVGTTGLTALQMQNSANFNFDFTGVWNISGALNGGFPYLR